MPVIDIFAWIVLAGVVLTLVAAFAALGAMPGRIAPRRGHPWAQAVTEVSRTFASGSPKVRMGSSGMLR